MKLAPQQSQAALAVKAWLADPQRKPFFYLAGYAGTGKTTIAKELANDVETVLYAAFTGKAALVLETKGCHGASTIHSLIYKNERPKDPVPLWVIDKGSAVRTADLVIIDECSMVGEELGRDLLSFGVPVLVLGDPEQLPPVGGEGFFTKGEPDFILTEVHRQAADNPIIRMSMIIREGGQLGRGNYGESVVLSRETLTTEMVLGADQVLVGKNSTRHRYNDRLRALKGFKNPYFEVNDRAICLKNKKDAGLLNGSLWNVDEIRNQDDEVTTMVVSPIDAGMARNPVLVSTHHAWLKGTEADLDWRQQKRFNPFDFGYALSVHKAQGSQWDSVCIFDESWVFKDDAQRWLYTAVTRAAEKVTVIV
jgi:exodeoxyribonuclease-5